MTEFQAAILLAHLSKNDEKVAIRERNKGVPGEGIAEIPGLAPLDATRELPVGVSITGNFNTSRLPRLGAAENTLYRARCRLKVFALV